MRKIAVISLVLVFAAALPAFAQQPQPTPQQQTQLPLIASGLLDRADQSLSDQDYQKAVLDLSLFIMLNPTYSPAYYGRAQGYAGLSNFDSALQDVNQALTMATTIGTPAYNAALYSLRGQIDQQQQHYDTALDDFTQSITFQPTASALANRGLLYMSNNDMPSALKDLNDAIGLNSSNAALYVYRGLVNTRLKDLQSSGADYLHFFTLLQASPVNHATIQPGQAVSLNEDRAVVHIVPFAAKAGQYASALAVGRGGDVDPLMVLIDAQGNPLAGDDDSGGGTSALILDYKIATDGQYALVVGHSLGGYTGQILLQLQLSDTPSQ